MQFAQEFAQQERNLSTVENVRTLPRIEIEYDVRGLLYLGYAVQERMQLQCRHARCPCQRRYIVDEDVIDVGSTFTARHRKSLHQFRYKSRCIFFVECLAVNAMRITLQRYR